MKKLKEEIEDMIKKANNELEKKEINEGEGKNSYDYFLGIYDILHDVIKKIEKSN